MSILDIVTHTPLWVWAVLALVLTLGIMRTRDRVLSLPRLLLLPAIMALLALSGLVGLGVAALPAILVGLAAGGVTGWLLERKGATRRLASGKLWLRGEWLSLVQILVVFVFRYTTNVVSAVNPDLASSSAWHLGTGLISSFLAALFVARAAARLRVYFTSEPVAA